MFSRVNSNINPRRSSIAFFRPLWIVELLQRTVFHYITLKIEICPRKVEVLTTDFRFQSLVTAEATPHILKPAVLVASIVSTPFHTSCSSPIHAISKLLRSRLVDTQRNRLAIAGRITLELV
jgi:hypothetical protein